MRSRHSKYYKLDERGEPVACADMFEWAMWFEATRRGRQVRRTSCGPGLVVSTVFLGLDHAWGDGPPVLWETMVFAKGRHDGHELGDYMQRCSGSREQAVAMHHAVCAMVWPQLKGRKIRHAEVP